MKVVVASMFVAALAWASTGRADVTRAQCAETYERAQVLRRDGKLHAAREALLVCSQKECPAVTTGDCARWLAEVEALLPTISVAVRDAKGADLPATLTLDGAPLTLPAGQTIHIDPGAHHVHATTSDGRSGDIDFVARSAEQNRLVTISMPELVTSPPVAHTTEPPQEAPVSGAPSIVPPVALTAVGIIGIGVAIGFGVHAKSEADDVRAQCAPYCPGSSLDSVHRNLAISDVGLGVGVVAAAIGTYLWVRYFTHQSATGSLKGGSVASAAFHF